MVGSRFFWGSLLSVVTLGVACGESDDTPTPNKPSGGKGGKGGTAGASGEAGDVTQPGAGKGGSSARGGSSGKGGSSATGGSSGEAGSESGGTHGGKGGSSGTHGGTSGTSTGGTSTAGEAGSASGGEGGGNGGELAALVRDFVDDEWAALCHAMFTCSARSDDDIASVALLGTEARCTELLSTARSLNLGREDLAARVQAGTVTFLPSKVSDCLAALASCGVTGWVPLGTKACRDVFEGPIALGQSCERSEQCAGDAVCTAADTCPGTCTARPGPDAPCDGTSDCDADGTVVCDRRVLDINQQGACHAPVVHAAAGEGEACDRSPSATLEYTPCAAGHFCDGDGSGSGTGLCHAPLAADAPCDSASDVCVSGHWCLDAVSCKPYTIAREANAPCGDDDLIYCDPMARLTCIEGSCILNGDGHDGSDCNGLDMSEFHACDPDLNCGWHDGEGGAGPTETCEAPRAGSAPCNSDRDCASGSCQPDGMCATAYCETPGY